MFLVTKPNSVSDVDATLPDITFPEPYEDHILHEMYILDGPLIVEGLMQ